MPASDGLRVCQSKRSGKYTGARAAATAFAGLPGACAEAGAVMPADTTTKTSHVAPNERRADGAENGNGVMRPPGRMDWRGCYPSLEFPAW